MTEIRYLSKKTAQPVSDTKLTGGDTAPAFVCFVAPSVSIVPVKFGLQKPKRNKCGVRPLRSEGEYENFFIYKDRDKSNVSQLDLFQQEALRLNEDSPEDIS